MPPKEVDLSEYGEEADGIRRDQDRPAGGWLAVVVLAVCVWLVIFTVAWGQGEQEADGAAPAVFSPTPFWKYPNLPNARPDVGPSDLISGLECCLGNPI